VLILICCAIVLWPRKRKPFISNHDINAHRITVRFYMDDQS